MTTATPDPQAVTAPGFGALPITALEVRSGDVLVYQGREIEVTAWPRPGSYWFGAERHEGLAINWRSSTACGILFGRGEETMQRGWLVGEQFWQELHDGGRHARELLSDFGVRDRYFIELER